MNVLALLVACRDTPLPPLEPTTLVKTEQMALEDIKGRIFGLGGHQAVPCPDGTAYYVQPAHNGEVLHLGEEVLTVFDDDNRWTQASCSEAGDLWTANRGAPRAETVTIRRITPRGVGETVEWPSERGAGWGRPGSPLLVDGPWLDAWGEAFRATTVPKIVRLPWGSGGCGGRSEVETERGVAIDPAGDRYTFGRAWPQAYPLGSLPGGWIRNSAGSTLHLPFPVVGLVFTIEGPLVLVNPRVPIDFMGERFDTLTVLPWPGLASDVAVGGRLLGREVPPTRWPDWAGPPHRVRDLPEEPVFAFVVGRTERYVGTIVPGPIQPSHNAHPAPGRRSILGASWTTDHWVFLPPKLSASDLARVETLLAGPGTPLSRPPWTEPCQLLPIIEMAKCVRDERATLLADPTDDDRLFHYTSSIERLLVLLAFSQDLDAEQAMARYRKVLEVPHADRDGRGSGRPPAAFRP